MLYMLNVKKKLKKRKKHLSQPEDEMKRLFRISASETTWMDVNICKGTHREMGRVREKKTATSVN